MTPASASQTAGPYWHLIDHPEWADLTRDGGVTGERVVLTGQVLDGDGAPCTDIMMELWQAGPDGRYDGAFHGFGRCATDADGRYRFTTLLPGPVRGNDVSSGNNPSDQTQAPHVTLTLFARGLLRQLVTRLYFAGEPMNVGDPVLDAAGSAGRETLIAEPEGANVWRLDIRLQGPGQTVFLDV